MRTYKTLGARIFAILFFFPLYQKVNGACHDRHYARSTVVRCQHPSLGCVALEIKKSERCLDRKFVVRWVLFIEGDGRWMSMTGHRYIYSLRLFVYAPQRFLMKERWVTDIWGLNKTVAKWTWKFHWIRYNNLRKPFYFFYKPLSSKLQLLSQSTCDSRPFDFELVIRSSQFTSLVSRLSLPLTTTLGLCDYTEYGIYKILRDQIRSKIHHHTWTALYHLENKSALIGVESVAQVQSSGI